MRNNQKCLVNEDRFIFIITVRGGIRHCKNLIIPHFLESLVKGEFGGDGGEVD
jgi:hypothetical protein